MAWGVDMKGGGMEGWMEGERERRGGWKGHAWRERTQRDEGMEGEGISPLSSNRILSGFMSLGRDRSIHMYIAYEHHTQHKHTPVCYSCFMQVSQPTGDLCCIEHTPLLTEAGLPNVVYVEPQVPSSHQSQYHAQRVL